MNIAIVFNREEIRTCLQAVLTLQNVINSTEGLYVREELAHKLLDGLRSLEKAHPYQPRDL